MYMNADCCEPQVVNCSGCLSDAQLADMTCDIGPISGPSIVEESGSVPRTIYYRSPFDGNTYVQSQGDQFYKYHSVDVSPLGGEITLQSHPSIQCLWQKRSVKLVQQVYHMGGNRYHWGGPILGYDYVEQTVEHYYEDTVQYPYVSADQWTLPPAPAQAWDSRCDTSVVPDPILNTIKWKCINTWVSAELTLRVTNMSVFEGLAGQPAYDCFIGQTLQQGFPDAVPYWLLELRIGRIAPQWSNFTWTGDAPEHTEHAGRNEGYVYPTGFTEIQDTGKPPYTSIDPTDWCSNAGNLYSGYGANVLRWTKVVDCDVDFNGDPIILDLDFPRPVIPAGAGCVCPMSKTKNASFIGVTGFNTTAVITPGYQA